MEETEYIPFMEGKRGKEERWGLSWEAGRDERRRRGGENRQEEGRINRVQTYSMDPGGRKG